MLKRVALLLTCMMTGAAPLAAQIGGEAPEPLVGKIVAVRGDAVTLDLGADAGVVQGNQFDVFSNPEVILLPGTKEPILSQSRVVARILVGEVGPKQSIGQLFDREAGAEIAANLRIIRGIERRINSRPEIKAARLKPEEPRWGDVVEIDLDVVDIEKDVTDYRWDAADGVFLDVPPARWDVAEGVKLAKPLSGASQAATLGPRIRWVCPRDAGEVVVTVEARDTGGPAHTGVLQFRIPAGGKPEVNVVERLTPEGIFAGMSRHFVRVDDLAFDAEGRAYVLDTNTERVICLNPDFSMAWASRPWNPEWRPIRIAASKDAVLILDGRARDVKEFRARPEMFDGPPERVFGAAGGRGFRMRRPVSLALGPQGEIYAADAELGAVLRFDREGASQVQIGGRGERRGQALDVSDVAATAPDLVWILDRARNKVVVYAGLKLRAELDAVGSGDAPVALGTIGNDVFVLGGRHVWAIGLDGAPRPIVSPAPRAFWSLEGARDLAGSPFGYLHVIGADQESLLRFNRGGAFAGQWGGADFSSAYRVAVNDAGAMALLSYDPPTVWKLDRQGWITDWMSTEGMQIYDVALAGNGGLWLLDAAQNRLVQAANGPPIGAGSIGLAAHRIAGAVGLSAGLNELHVLERRGASLWVHTFDTDGVPVEGGARALAGSRLQDGHRLHVDPDGLCFVWGTGAACRIFDAAGKALTSAAIPPAAAGAFPGLDDSVFSLDLDAGEVWLSRPRQNPLRFAGEGLLGQPLDLAVDGLRRLYVLDGARGRIVRLAP